MEIWMIQIFLIAILVLVCVVGWQLLVRKLSDRGWFWVRVPESTYLAITRDKVVWKILVACSSEMWALIEEQHDPDIKITRVRKGLNYIGPPWKYRVHEWHETQEDEENPAVPALHSVDLAEQILKYPSKIDDSILGIPNFKTADGIEARSSLSVFLIVHNPNKALFAVRYRKTAILNKILPVWREVVAKFEFFEYKKVLEGGEDLQAIMGRKLSEINKDLRVAFGISEIKNDREIRVDDPKNLTSGSAAEAIYEDWGTWIRDLALEDFDAADATVEKAMEQILISATEAIQAKQRALGEKSAKIAISEGEAQALGNLMKALGTGDEGKFIMALQAFEKMGAQGNMILSLPEISTLASSFLKIFQGKGGTA